jgi:hypothetical protein
VRLDIVGPKSREKEKKKPRKASEGKEKEKKERGGDGPRLLVLVSSFVSLFVSSLLSFPFHLSILHLHSQTTMRNKKKECTTMYIYIYDIYVAGLFTAALYIYTHTPRKTARSVHLL